MKGKIRVLRDIAIVSGLVVGAGVLLKKCKKSKNSITFDVGEEIAGYELFDILYSNGYIAQVLENGVWKPLQDTDYEDHTYFTILEIDDDEQVIRLKKKEYENDEEVEPETSESTECQEDTTAEEERDPHVVLYIIEDDTVADVEDTDEDDEDENEYDSPSDYEDVPLDEEDS